LGRYSCASRFPSVKGEIDAGVDRFALTHYTACVFHMMRVAEIGMRSLAHSLPVSFPRHPLEWADWENVIDGIESKSKTAYGWTEPRGPIRDAARAFYSAAVAQLRAFKETRNRVMHTRGPPLNDLDAQKVMRQVRDFMNGLSLLSLKIGEKTKTPIRRWP
jgi:hypothetical protein